MTEAAKLVVVGFSALIFGIVLLICYKSFSRRAAEQMKERGMSEFYKFEYSEEFFRLLSIFSGILCSLSGLAMLLGQLADKQQGIWVTINDFVMSALIIFAFGGGLIFIIYCNLKF